MNILYVEDNPGDADLARRALRKSAPHFNLDLVGTQREALARLSEPEASRYDPVLTDMRLPNGDGLAILTHIRGRSLPLAVVLITGAGDEETAVAVLKAGADDYVVKRGDYLARLPLTLEDALHHYRAEAVRRTRPLRVLYAEHNATDVDLTRRHLAAHAPHIHLDVVGTAPEVLQRLPQTSEVRETSEVYYDLLLLDYRLPGLNALELLKELRQVRGLDVPVVLVTGRGDEEVALQALKLGAADYVPKNPGYLYQLPSVLENVFHRAQLAREQAALRESEARFRRLAENAQDLIYRYRFTPTPGFEYVSPAATTITGYTPEEHYADPDLGFKLVHPDDRPLLEKYFQGEGVFRQPITLRWVHKDGTVIWTEQRNVPIYDEAGNLVALEGIARDVTERVRAEEQVRSLATKLKAIARPARQMSALLNLDALVQQVVQSLQEITGCYNVNLFLRENDAVVFAAGRGGYVDGRPPLGYRLPLGQGIIGHVAQTGQPLPVPDVSQDPHYVAWEGLPHTRSELAVPVKRGDRVLGVIDMQSTELNAFDAADLEALGVLADQLAVALENTRLFEETQRRLAYLQALRNVDMAITASLDLRVTLDVLLDQVITQLHVDAAAVLLFNPHMHTLEYAAGRGFRTAALRHTSLRLGDGLAGRAALERQTVSISDLRLPIADLEGGQSEIGNLKSAIQQEGFVAYYGAPLVAKGQIKGVLEIFHRAPLVPAPEWLDFLEAMAAQTAIAIDNVELFESLQRANVELTLAYDTTLEGWALALELRDYETEGHTRRVADLTMRLARAMGVSDAELAHIHRGALLHDIGKMAISDTILLKPGPLTEDEWGVMRQHPVYAYKMLSPIAFLHRALDIPYCHHEKWDGTGYPRGLKGEQIPLAARIFAVVDVWDALLSARPYREAWPEEKVREYIQEQAGKHFDPQVVEVFLKTIERR